MAKHAQAIRLQKPTDCLCVLDHFVRLALKGLRLVLTSINHKLCTPSNYWNVFDTLAQQNNFQAI